MQVHRDLDKLPVFRKAVITIGTFDGVHCGHQKILRQLKEEAAACGGESIVITFHPHPREILRSSGEPVRLLTPLEEKIYLLGQQGIDHLVVVPFTRDFSQLSAEEYISAFLVRNFHPHIIIIGYDHHFGHNREGDIRYLESVQEKYHFRLVEIPEQVIHDLTVSSTKIRHHLAEGHVALANELLGYTYFLSGNVVHGDKRGRELGYPTANIAINDSRKLIPRKGIYAVKAGLHDRYTWTPLHDAALLPGVMSIGYRPTFDGDDLRVEVFLFDFDQNIYGQSVTVYFSHYLRDEEKFDSAEALVQQMKKDEQQARDLLRDK